MLSTSIIIATRNRGSKITATLKSILQNTVKDFELIVIDQSTNLETFEAVKPFTADPRVKYKLINIPGTSHARNLGIKETRGDIIINTDDDCIVPVDWIEKTLAPFEKYPNVGITFGNVEPLPYDPSKGYTPQYKITDSKVYTKRSEVLRGFGHGIGLGAAMAMRRTVMEEINGFDEVLGPGQKFPSAEDKDVAIRALVKGWQIFENADVVVIHDGFRTLEEVRKLMKRDMYGAGGTFGKLLKCGVWEILPMIIIWAFTMGIWTPISSCLHGNGLRGFKRLLHFSQGVLDGLKLPVDRQTLSYKTSEIGRSVPVSST